MKQVFDLDIEAFSINAVFSRDKRWKTSAYKHWEMKLFMQLSSPENQKKLKALREAYQIGDTFSVRFIFYHGNFYTKAGQISAHTEDLSNVEKVLLDCFFLEKYCRHPVPYGAPNIAQDDRFVTTLISQKKPTTRRKSHTTVQIRLIKGRAK